MNFFQSCKFQSDVKLSWRTERHCDAFLFRPVFENTVLAAIELTSGVLSWALPPEFQNSRAIACDAFMVKHDELFDLATVPATMKAKSHWLFRIDSTTFLLAGLLTCRKLLADWTLRQNTLSLTLHGDGKTIEAGERFEADEFCFLSGSSEYDVMTRYAALIAERNPRKRQPQTSIWRGWGMWWEYTEDELLENFEECRKLYPQTNILQVDAGYATWGDWLDVRKNVFPNGMKPFTDKVVAANAHAGLWMAPFWADVNSKLYLEHPDWFLKKADGTTRTEYSTGFYLATLDYSQDAVCDWWEKVLATARREWNYSYFKFDFLAAGLNPCRGKFPMTPLERFHRCFDIVERVCGDNTFVLGCSAFFPPCYGRVDAMRTGPDIHPSFEPVKASAWGNAASLHLNKKVFQADADYLELLGPDNAKPVLGHKKGQLSDAEAGSWANFASLFNGIVLAADDLPRINRQRRELVLNELMRPLCDEVFALDQFAGNGELPPSAYLARRGRKIEILLFNWSEKKTAIQVFDTDQSTIVSATLAPHASCRLELADTRTFSELAASLHLNESAIPRFFKDVRTEPFHPEGKLAAIPLGNAAKVTLHDDRLGQCGMLNGKYARILSESKIAGVPFDFSISGEKVVEQSSLQEKGFCISVNRTVSALYFLQNAFYPVRGRLTTYRFFYTDGSMESEEIFLGEHIGNSDFHYSLPWHGIKGTVGWADAVDGAVFYVTKWSNPHPEKELLRIESDKLDQPVCLYIAGVTAEISG